MMHIHFYKHKALMASNLGGLKPNTVPVSITVETWFMICMTMVVGLDANHSSAS